MGEWLATDCLTATHDLRVHQSHMPSWSSGPPGGGRTPTAGSLQSDVSSAEISHSRAAMSGSRETADEVAARPGERDLPLTPGVKYLPVTPARSGEAARWIEVSAPFSGVMAAVNRNTRVATLRQNAELSVPPCPRWERTKPG